MKRPLSFIAALLISTPCLAMDSDVFALSVYGLDINLCGLSVPQSYKDRHLVEAGIRYYLSPPEIALMAARETVKMEDELRVAGKAREYCEGRRVK